MDCLSPFEENLAFIRLNADFATDMLSSAKMYMRQRNKRRGSDGSCLRYVLFVCLFVVVFSKKKKKNTRHVTWQKDGLSFLSLRKRKMIVQ